jgi:nucleotide-binding universal stress UspA family protein
MTRDAGWRSPVVMVPVVGAAETTAAVAWAADYVASHDGTLVLVGTWPGPVRYGLPPFTVIYDPEPAARDSVHAVAGSLALEPDQVQTVLLRGDTGRILATRSPDVDLLVVGRRAEPRLVELLLGSLGTYCVRRAACPVVVVPVERSSNGSAAVVVEPDVIAAARPPAGALTWAWSRTAS